VYIDFLFSLDYMQRQKEKRRGDRSIEWHIWYRFICCLL
jgi:hypothetical protein